MGGEEGTLRALLEQQLAAEVVQPMGFIVSKTRGGKCRRLHFAGGCFGRPGEHYRSWEDLGQGEPAEHLYNCRCQDCFPASRTAQRQLEAEVEASALDGTSDSDSSEMGEDEGAAFEPPDFDGP